MLSSLASPKEREARAANILEYPSENSDATPYAAEIQANLRAVGIAISLHPVRQATWADDGDSRKTPFIVGG